MSHGLFLTLTLKDIKGKMFQFSLLVTVNTCPERRDVVLPCVTLPLDYTWILFFFFFATFLNLKTWNHMPLNGVERLVLHFLSFSLTFLLSPKNYCKNSPPTNHRQTDKKRVD